jgi:hypothetical protein
LPSVEKNKASRSLFLIGFGVELVYNKLDDKIYKDSNTEKSDSTFGNMGFSLGAMIGLAPTNWLAFVSEFNYFLRDFINTECSVDCTEIIEHSLEFRC